MNHEELVSAWDDAMQTLKAAAEIVYIITQMGNAKNVERVAHAWPTLRTQLEKARADLKAAAKYGRPLP